MAIASLSPTSIPLESVSAWGVPALRARGLVVQGSDPDGRIWATRGQWAYRLEPGAGAWERRYRVPTGRSPYAARSLRWVRSVTRQPVAVELLPLAGEGAVALSAGVMWSRANGSPRFQKTLALEHFGPGVGSGLLAPGLTATREGGAFFGEYWRNPDRRRIRVFASHDAGSSWQPVHTFADGAVRHVHAIQQDPYTGDVWICTGDGREECLVARGDARLHELSIVGRGGEEHQAWRTCQCVFTQDAVYWGADTREAGSSGLYRWDRATQKLDRLCSVPGAIRYATRLADGTILLSTDRAGGANERDDRVWLWLLGDDDEIRALPMARWKRARAGSGAAVLRMPRVQDLDRLYVTPLRVDAFEGDLLVFESAALKAAAGPPPRAA